VISLVVVKAALNVVIACTLRKDPPYAAFFLCLALADCASIWVLVTRGCKL
jgi:NADH:ubiquinone oxidoreductase subunit 6 (subunit J)